MLQSILSCQIVDLMLISTFVAENCFFMPIYQSQLLGFHTKISDFQQM